MSKFTLLAADKLADEGLEFVRSQTDAELLDRPDLVDLKKSDGQDAVDAEVGKLLSAGGIHAMVVRSGIKVTPAMLAEPGDLKVIARAGVGVDNIDLPAATAKGILVVNTAEASTITTAEHAFALMMALLRNVGPAYKTMTEGGWDRNKYKGRQLHGLTLGVVGLGRIGRTVAERALAFGMDVVGYDPFVNTDLQLGDRAVKTHRAFADLVPHADVLSFHVPKTPETTGMLDAAVFAKCRPGVFVVNAARGGIVDEADLIAACDAGQCGGAALDVFTTEPPAEDSPLRTHPKILVTPHLGASTEEAQTAVSVDAAKACLAYLRGEGISGAVNAGGVRVDLTDAQAAYVDLADRMARLISPMVTRGVARLDVELCGQALGPAAGTIERTALVGLLQRNLDTPLNVINVGAVAEARGIETRVTQREHTTTAPSQLTLTIHGPRIRQLRDIERETDSAAAGFWGNTHDKKFVDENPDHEADKVRRIVGRVYDDLRPRVVEINGYAMDMVPEGHMVIIQNDDRPGMIGMVGTEFGKAGVNIADMTISRRENPDGSGATALMLLKTDEAAPYELHDAVGERPGILKIAGVHLAEVTSSVSR
ncbi:MAG: NAD(P)-dependent oxidoreductase [Planctomycetota bacterium]